MRERRPNSADDRARTEPPTSNFALTVASTQRKGRGASPLGQAQLIYLVDALIEHYVSWREECATVESSYRNWSRAESGDRTLAFSAYLAALDREELAARSYRRVIAELAQI
jgi:hypothetical protein